MNYLLRLFLILLSFNILACTKSEVEKKHVITGADLIVSENFELIKNKNIAVVTNHTAVLSNGVHLIDTLFNTSNVTIKALFGPEHGIRGNNSDGTKINDNIDDKTGIPIYSLYGKTLKPTSEMLNEVDVVIFDIQDIGARFYTYISTMYNVMEACAELDKQMIVLDRPNPIGGIKVDGPLRHDSLKSFVAIAPIPIQHGMTIGELAFLFNEKYLAEKVDLKIVKVNNWKREYLYDECNIRWINPSPNMPNLETAIVYPGMCFLEGTNISEGRGTYEPFLTFGAPFINSEQLINELEMLNIKGIKLTPTQFTPVKIPNMATWVKYENELCSGVKIEITNREEIQSVRFGIKLLFALNKLYKDDFAFREKRIDKLFGNEYLRIMILEGKTPDEIISVWEKDLEEFKTLRKNYLLY
ncbi:MAG: DUF1343 domain-containing protein [Melioribacteraceae bacterium]|nr:DUF1343 domain-containing protein [Melioribacteraceae bacterium]